MPDKASSDWRQREGVERNLTPDIPVDDLLRILKKNMSTPTGGIAQFFTDRKREQLCQDLRGFVENRRETASLQLRAVISVFADLFEQGWTLLDYDSLTLQPPGQTLREGEPFASVKERLRTYLKSGQRRQLNEPSVQKFMHRMFNVVRPQGRHSIVSVIDNGQELADLISKASSLEEHKRDAYLSKIIKPKIEVCDADARCPDTGLKLLDIWRFFRHTWLTEYRPIPGRQMPVLIRNAARKNRPVMGIAMLASPVMRLSVRDKWIGWETNLVLDGLRDGKIDRSSFIVAMHKRLEASIQDIRWDDLIAEDAIHNPGPNHIDWLDRLAVQANHRHQEMLRDIEETGSLNNAANKDPDLDKMTDEIWRQRSEDDLYVGKRASTLSSLLRAKLLLSKFDLFNKPSNIRYLKTSKDGIYVLETVLSEFRKDGMANHVMDLSVCGAVPPYGALLTGKLVTMLLLSAEVNEKYRERYGSNPRIIASQMAGRPIVKPTSLRILTTTSLFGVGTSQYNRLVLRKADHYGIPHDLKWEQLGEQSAGYGTIHLSSNTQQFLRRVAIVRHGARRINSRFGEGSSAGLRQAREGLDALGLDSGSVLHHATPRIVLGCRAEEDTELSMLGIVNPKPKKRPTVNAISRAWRKRWLMNRVTREEVIARIHSEGSQFLHDMLVVSKPVEDESEQPSLS